MGGKYDVIHKISKASNSGVMPELRVVTILVVFCYNHQGTYLLGEATHNFTLGNVEYYVV
jgi:hypothetical protein